jgi:hypothetical protein
VTGRWLVFGGAIVGAVVGGIVGWAINPIRPDAFVDLSGLYPVSTAGVGFVAGRRRKSSDRSD